jgi:hypothetical protein
MIERSKDKKGKRLKCNTEKRKGEFNDLEHKKNTFQSKGILLIY